MQHPNVAEFYVNCELSNVDIWVRPGNSYSVFFCAGGPLTITDANLCLGRLLPEYVL